MCYTVIQQWVAWYRAYSLHCAATVIQCRMMWSGSASGELDALFQWNIYSKNRDTKLLPVALLQMTSVGKNHRHNKQPHHMGPHCCWCPDRKWGWQQLQRMNWRENFQNFVAMQPERLPMSTIRRMMRLFGKAWSIHRGESWKILLSSYPTQSECVFTQPPGDPAQAGPDRWIQSGQRGLQRNKAGLQLHSVVLLQGNHPWSYHYGIVLPGRDDARWLSGFSLCHNHVNYFWVIIHCVCVWAHRWTLSAGVSHHLSVCQQLFSYMCLCLQNVFFLYKYSSVWAATSPMRQMNHHTTRIQNHMYWLYCVSTCCSGKTKQLIKLVTGMLYDFKYKFMEW